MWDSDDEIGLAALEGFEQGAGRGQALGPANHQQDAVQPPRPLQAANFRSGSALPPPLACPPVVSTGALPAASSIRHLFCAEQQLGRTLQSAGLAHQAPPAVASVHGRTPASGLQGGGPASTSGSRRPAGPCSSWQALPLQQQPTPYQQAMSACGPMPPACTPAPTNGSAATWHAAPVLPAAFGCQQQGAAGTSSGMAQQGIPPAHASVRQQLPEPLQNAGQLPQPARTSAGEAGMPAAPSSSSVPAPDRLKQGAQHDAAANMAAPAALPQRPQQAQQAAAQPPEQPCQQQEEPPVPQNPKQAPAALLAPPQGQLVQQQHPAGSIAPQNQQQQPAGSSAAPQDQQSQPAGSLVAPQDLQQQPAGAIAPQDQQPQPPGQAAPEACQSGAQQQAAKPADETAAAPARSKSRLRQLFDYLAVYDLEATCDRDKSKQPTPQEIIELSCVIVDTSTLQLLGSFQRYVKPDQHPKLTEFCTELTGITQEMVDAGIPLGQALHEHTEWLREQGLIGQGKTFVPVTWRDWDLKIQMAMECKWRRIDTPRYLLRWVDLNAVWVKHSGKRGNLRASVEAAGLEWEGRAHSAIDDARATARLAVKLMQSGVILGVTGSFSGVDASGRFRQGTLLGMANAGASGAAGAGSRASVGGGGANSGRTGGGGSKASGSGKPSGGSLLQPARKKQRIHDSTGAWNGCCYCGAKAKKRSVKRPGANNGRDFWSCGKFSMTGGAQCDFFQWM